MSETTVLFEEGDPQKNLFNDAILEMELEKAKDSTLYKFLISEAKRAANQAAVGLVEVDPTYTMLVMRLQNEVKRLNDLIMWVDQAIDRGTAAREQLLEMDTSDS